MLVLTCPPFSTLVVWRSWFRSPLASKLRSGRTARRSLTHSARPSILLANPLVSNHGGSTGG